MRFGSLFIGITFFIQKYGCCLSYHARKLSICENQNNRCYCCGVAFGPYIPVDIHHRDHNSRNWNRSNLIALCCNCHQAHHRNGVLVDVKHSLCKNPEKEQKNPIVDDYEF
tara:strand:- start:287 stop:619 length:333 start_codon:yes stop_codon:yes gene_type:complete